MMGGNRAWTSQFKKAKANIADRLGIRQKPLGPLRFILTALAVLQRQEPLLGRGAITGCGLTPA